MRISFFFLVGLFIAGSASAQPPVDDWAAVRAVHPGTALRVARRDADPAKRYLVDASEDGLLLLDVSGAAITSTTAEALIGAATNHPEYFATNRPADAIYLDHYGRAWRFSGRSVSQDQKRVALLDDVLERTARDDVLQVSIVTKGQHGAGRGAAIGLILGVGIGVSIQIPYCAHHSCGDTAGVITMTSALVSTALGAVVGAVVRENSETERVIYRHAFTVTNPSRF